jgi:hypothetical protein
MKPAPMPQTQKLGPHVFTILRKLAAHMPLIDGGKPNGWCDKDRAQIAVVKGARRSKAQEWLTHETLHGIWPEGDPNEEKHVTELAPKILQWIQDNPEVMEYLRT